MRFNQKLLSVYFLLLAVCFQTSLSFAQQVSVPIPQKSERTSVPDIKTNENSAQNAVVAKPKRPYQAACPAVLSGLVKARPLPPISNGECGERSPLEVSAFDSVKLAQPIKLNCRMATNLAKWAANTQLNANTIFDSKLAQIQVSTSYQCRRRNNAPTGKISEHGFANALDITGFTLADGKVVNILSDWGSNPTESEQENDNEDRDPNYSSLSQEARFLRETRDAACNLFTTVLSPNTNAAHANHFHFDLGCHGKTCTYTICE